MLEESTALIALFLQAFLVSGGVPGRADPLDSTEIYEPSLGSWRAGAALPNPMVGMRAAQINNRVLMFGIIAHILNC